MQALTKGLVAGAVGLLVLVPAGIAIADDDGSWLHDPHDPVCTEDQRHDHWQVQDRMHDGMQVVIDEVCPGVGPARTAGSDDDRPAMPNDDRPGMPNDDRAGWHDERSGPVGDHHRMGR